MQELLQKVLTDPKVRNKQAMTVVATANAKEFTPWGEA